MRHIRKKAPPASLTEWRRTQKLADGSIPSYSELRREVDALRDVERQLLAEQGSLCAYTGHEIRPGEFHIEHLLAQAYCTKEFGLDGMDTDYSNLVACWPAPNYSVEPAYGAIAKKSWPPPRQGGVDRSFFVSPLDPTCERRFVFLDDGSIEVKPEDGAAVTTVSKLNLNADELKDLREQAIRGALEPNGFPESRRKRLKRQLEDLRAKEAQIDVGGTPALRAFSFALKQAIERRIELLSRKKEV